MSKSKKEEKQLLIQEFRKAVDDASKKFGKHPFDVTKAEYTQFSPISDWDLRKLGGFSNLKKLYFPADDQDLAAIHDLKKAKSYISRLEKQVGEKESFENQVKEAILDRIKPIKVKPYKPKTKRTKEKKHVVGMLNDLHIGLKVEESEVDGLNKYNFEIASRRVAMYIKQLCNYKLDKRDEVETLHLLINGDLIAGIIHGLNGQDLYMLTHQFNGAVHILSSAISRLAENYKHVKVYFSTGNHGDSPHRREGHRVLSQIYDSIEGQIFYAISISHKSTKNVEFIAGHTLYQDFQLPAGRAAFTHGHIMFSAQLGNPGSSLNTKGLGVAINDFNTSQRNVNKEEVKLFLFGHTHCHFHITTRNGVEVYNAPSLSGIDSYAYSIGITYNLVAQVFFESTPDYILGDSRLVHLNKADDDESLDSIITPYKQELVYGG